MSVGCAQGSGCQWQCASTRAPGSTSKYRTVGAGKRGKYRGLPQPKSVIRWPFRSDGRGTKGSTSRTEGAPRLPFVGRGTVDGRYGDVVQSQVDAQLPPVVNDVVDDEGPERRGPWHREHLVAVSPERPRRRELPVGLIERSTRLRGRCEEQRHNGSVTGRLGEMQGGRGQLEGDIVQDGGTPVRDVRHVLGQTAERHGPFVRPPGQALFGHTLEHLPRGCHLVVVLGQQRVSNGQLP